MEEDWQKNLTNIKDRGEFLLSSEKFTDCVFQVCKGREERSFACHKLILAMASPVFERMFYGSLPAADSPIPVDDIEPETFQSLLMYIYSDTLAINSIQSACDLYYASNKYMIPYVLEKCTKYILENITHRDACKVYEFAKFYDQESILKKSQEVLIFYIHFY